MKKKVNDNFLYCAERGESTGAYYFKTAVALTIKNHSEGTIGYFDGWELVVAPGTHYEGLTQKQLIDTLHELWPELKWHTKHTRDRICIYTDNLAKIQGFFEKYITEGFEDFYVILNEFFEVRPCDRWIEVGDVYHIAQQMQNVYNDYFIPGKYFYISPQQRNRKYLAKARKLTNDTTAELSYPKSYTRYMWDRKGYFSGLLYHPYQGIIEEPMLVLDITSSYIFDMLCERHVCSDRREVDTSMWEYYLSATKKVSFGAYKISYAMPFNHISCFTDIKGNKLEPGEHTVQMMLTNVDLKNLLDIGYIKSIECELLYEFDIDYLPKYVIEAIAEAYIAKVEAADDEALKAIRKPILNGFYGDTIRRYDTKEEYAGTNKNPVLSPLWGIFTTSYSKKWLLELALKVDGWYYSDTDSIICLDNEKNRELLAQFNIKIRKIVKDWCEKFGYDYELFKNLGTFKKEHEITKLRVWKNKTYCYRYIEKDKYGNIKFDKDGKEIVKIVLKAAGLMKDSVELNEKLFYTKDLDYTRTKYPIIVPASESQTGESYYVEFTPNNKMQYYIMLNELAKVVKNKRA